MAEKILSPGVFTNEIDQSFLPATAGPVGAAIVGPTVKGPVLIPTVVSSYNEYVNIFGELIQSGSSKFQFLTSHTAKEYLRQGGPLTVVRVADADASRATAHVTSGSYNGTVKPTTIFTIEALGDGPTFNNTTTTVTGSFGTDNLLPPQATSATNDHFGSGSFGGRNDNFRWEVSQRNLKKGTFTLLIRQGDDTTKKKKVLETWSNLSMDPEQSNYVERVIGNQTLSVVAEDGVAYLQPSGEFANASKYIRISNVVEDFKTPGYLDSQGNIATQYDDHANGEGSFFPTVGSGSYGGAFGNDTRAFLAGTGQTAGSAGLEQVHPYKFYDNITTTNSQGVAIQDSNDAVSGATVGGGYMTALSLLRNKDEYDFNLLFLPGIIDQLTDHSPIAAEAISLCEDRGDAFYVMDNVEKTSTVSAAKTNAEARNTSYAASYYPWIQIQDSTIGSARFVPPSVVMAGVYHFNDTVGQPWFAPAGLNRGGIDSAIQAYRKLTQSNRDDLYDSNVNPIATFPGQGVTVFGQKTLQKKASALDRVNVRRLLINLKKFVASSSRTLLFEQNTTDLRNQFLNTVQPYMEQVQANQGLNAFRVVMDDTNNTPETIDRNQLIGQIFVQPSKTAEFIVLDFVVQPTGAAFPE